MDPSPFPAGEELEPPPRSWLKPLGWGCGALALVFLLTHQLLIGLFVVRGVSMQPTLSAGQRLVVFKRPAQISRGDVLVFTNPSAPEEVLVKRVLALPGERIEARGGRLLIDGREVPEPYAKPGTTLGTLPESELRGDAYFLVGDNRGASIDSRTLGPVPAHCVVGRVVWVF